MPSLAAQILQSIDAPPALLPHLAGLFESIESLGSPTRRAANLLLANLPRAPRVLDLACGKGDLVLHLTARLQAARSDNFQLVGIDASAPFIQHAHRRSQALDLSRRCTFIRGDIRRATALTRGLSPFDAACMLGLWPVSTAAPLVRSLVKPGGLLLLDDAVRDPRARGASAFADVPTLADLRGLLTAQGDRILHARMLPKAVVASMHAQLAKRLARNAAALRDQGLPTPAARALAEFLRRQRSAGRVLTGPLRPVLILAQAAR